MEPRTFPNGTKDMLLSVYPIQSEPQQTATIFDWIVWNTYFGSMWSPRYFECLGLGFVGAIQRNSCRHNFAAKGPQMRVCAGLHVLVHLGCHLHSVPLHFSATRKFPTFHTQAIFWTFDNHKPQTVLCRAEKQYNDRSSSEDGNTRTQLVFNLSKCDDFEGAPASWLQSSKSKAYIYIYMYILYECCFDAWPAGSLLHPVRRREPLGTGEKEAPDRFPQGGKGSPLLVAEPANNGTLLQPWNLETFRRRLVTPDLLKPLVAQFAISVATMTTPGGTHDGSNGLWTR